MSLSKAQIVFLKKLAHHLNPIVIVGKGGVSDGVLAELERALDDHELVKVKVAIDERDERRQMIEQITEKTNTLLVCCVGKVAVYYRAGEDNKILLPKR